MANVPILNGNGGPLRQFWQLEWTKLRGGTVQYEWQGLSLPAMTAQANLYATAGWDGSLRYEKNVATLTVKTPAGETTGIPGVNNPFNTITDKWEIGVDEETPSLFENQYLLAAVIGYDAPLGFPLSQQIFQCLKNVADTGNPTWANFWDSARKTKVLNALGAPITPVDHPDGVTISYYLLAGAADGTIDFTKFKYFADDYLRGRTNFIRGKYNLIHTTYAPADYAANVADFNVEKTYTIAQLLSEAQSNSLWIFPLPGYLSYKILNVAIPASMLPNYIWGAVKESSSAVTSTRNRIEIQTKYLIDACPLHTYPLAY